MEESSNLKGMFVSVIGKYTFIHEPIHEKCIGCDRVIEANDVKYCKAYHKPISKWKHDVWVCPLATHVTTDAPKSKEKQRVGQQKQKKRK